MAGKQTTLRTLLRPVGALGTTPMSADII